MNEGARLVRFGRNGDDIDDTYAGTLNIGTLAPRPTPRKHWLFLDYPIRCHLLGHNKYDGFWGIECERPSCSFNDNPAVVTGTWEMV